jgi:diadenylate cyclase
MVEFFSLVWGTIKEMLNWRVSLDILLIAGLIYFLYYTLRSLGTWKIIAGVFLTLVLFLAARLLGLQGINYLFSNFSHVALLALIIIFQPEIRRIFERAASLRRNESGGETTLLRSNLKEAIFGLAQKRCGAIFAFPGRDSIQPWTSEGISLEAYPSVPLLLSIFDPHTPGHDGAMVIRNGKASSFGVRLPVSKSGNLSDAFGTRHHAALGLSEVTDALVIVVSEERGSISTFRSGRMNPILHKGQIDLAIKSHWEETSAYPMGMQSGKKRWKPLAGLIGSLLLAFLFWSTVVVSVTEIREKGMVVPIEYTAPGEEIVLTGTKPTEVTLHLAGPKSHLDLLDPSQLAVKIDLTKASPGRQRVVVTGENIRLPKDIQLLGVDPPVIDFTLKALEEREVEIKPQLVGRLPEGLKLVTVEVSPKRVRILTPEPESFRKEGGLSTAPIYLEGITENTTLFTKIAAPPGIQPIDKHWPEVEVEIKVRGKPAGAESS